MPIPLVPETPPVGATPPAEPAAPVEPITLAQENLPPELQGKSQAEIQMMLAQMPTIVANQRSTITALEERLRTPVVAPLPPEPPPEPVDFDALMEENPEKALDHYMQSRYGSTIESIDQRLGAGEFDRVAAVTPGFAEHAEDVKVLLAQTKTPVTADNVRGAYAMVLGNKELERQATLRRAAATEPPAAPAPEDLAGAIVPLNPLEAEVAAAMGLSPEDFRKYGDADSFTPSIRVS